MIPNVNNNNNNNNQIKIQLTKDDKCIIETKSGSPIKSPNTKKYDFSINEDMSLSKSSSIINYNNSKNISKQKISNSSINNKDNTIKKDLENNSNILLSFSNISDITKFNYDLSVTKRKSIKKIA